MKYARSRIKRATANCCACAELDLSRVALATGAVGEAVSRAEKAARVLEEVGSANQPMAWSRLGIRLSGSRGDRRRLSRTPRRRWICCRQGTQVSLTISSRRSGGPAIKYWQRQPPFRSDGRTQTDIDDELWHVLDYGPGGMLNRVTTLSDDGLVRNYLNKLRVNREIVDHVVRAGPDPRRGPLRPGRPAARVG